MKKMIPLIGFAFCAAVGFVVWCCIYVGAKSDGHLYRGEEEGGAETRKGAPDEAFFEDDEDDFDISSVTTAGNRAEGLNEFTQSEGQS